MACGRTIRRLFAALGLFFFAVGSVAQAQTPAPAPADPLQATVKVETAGGYARIVFTFSDEIDASVRTAGNVLVISFAKPVYAAAEPIAMQAPEYIAAARNDPDNQGMRLALARPVKISTTSAGKKFFVDLLPDTWIGGPPGLPQDVIKELARRAREADRLERLMQKTAQEKKPDPVRVHVASQPTFTRYVFDLPEQVSVSADRGKDMLTLNFDAPLTFDLADAEISLPAVVAAINSQTQLTSAAVRFSFLSKVDVRTFRDGNSYVVDVVDPDRKAEQKAGAVAAALPDLAHALESAEKAPAAPAAPGAAAAPAEQAKADAPGAPPAPQKVAPPPAKAEAPPPPGAPAKVEAPPSSPAPPPAAPVAQKAEAAPAPAAAKAEALPAPPPAAAPVQKTEAPAASPADTPPAAKAETPPSPPTPPATKSPAAAPAPAATRAKPSPGAPDGSKGDDKITVEMSRQGVSLKLSFPFLAPTAAAVFHRADSLWLVFDSTATIDLSALEGESSRTIRAATFSRVGDAAVVRIRLDHPHLSSVATEGAGWTVTIGDTVTDPSRALDIARNMIGPNHSSITVPFEEPHERHRIRDPEVGDDLVVVTGFAPARGFISEQDFVEFHALASAQGIAIEPLADDLDVELAADKVVISRPGGLALSSTLQSVLRGSPLRSAMFDSQLWGFDQHATYSERQSTLIAAAAAAPESKRLAPRLNLARFYIARDMYPEAKGVLDVALSEAHAASADAAANVLRAVAEVMMNRPEDALKDLANPVVGDQHDAPLWRALAYSGQGKWALARDGFKMVESAIATLPIELQRVALQDEMRASIEVGDYAGAADHLNDIETIGVPREQRPTLAVLIGRLYEGMGRAEDALTAYQTAADSWDRPAAAQGRLRDVELRYALGDVKRPDAIAELETLTTIWRGDETEVEALEFLARLYIEEHRYRDSFYVMRSAVASHPDSDVTRRIQAEAAQAFESLFLAGKGDSLPAVEALALFYDFRDLTPIGRKGDEMIRRLADRLVTVDLLDQAAELLQYQVDHRLQGAARAQVATRLAVIYLMNRKSDRALATLRGSRTAEVSNELRNQRLLLEARSLSDLRRYDLALEVISNIEGREAIRLRADILWAARRWDKAAEQIELYYGDRWKDWQPLNEIERSDILRAAVGYALSEDTLGLNRFREKYAAKMARTPDARDFDIVSAPIGTSGTEFRNIARAAASVDTLDGFLRDMKARYPQASAVPPAPPAGAEPVSSTAPATKPAASPSPPARAAGRTALR
jgi:hypothetical protein